MGSTIAAQARRYRAQFNTPRYSPRAKRSARTHVRVQRKMRRAADQKSSCRSIHSIQGTIAFARASDVQNGVAYEPQHTAIESLSKRRQDTKDWLRRGERKLVGGFHPVFPSSS